MVAFFATFFSYSQNDLCANAITLTPSTNCVTTTGSFSGSSNTGTSTSCSASSLQDVWYSFVATDQTMSITLVNLANANLGMEIISGSCSGTSFVCDNTSSSLTSESFQSNAFVVGQTYFVRVFHVGTFEIASIFTICVQNYPTPANDACSNAVVLTPNANCVNTTGSFSGSSTTGATTLCSPKALQDVWYSFVATDPTMSVWITNGNNVNIGMEIITGSCTGTSFVCDDNSSSLSSEFYQNNTFVVGQTYYVRVYHSEAFLLTTSFIICVQNYPTPANDLCSGAITLTPSANCVTTTGSFSGSSNTGTSTSCSASSLQDVWYSFVATDPTMSVSITNGVFVNLGMEINTGSCSGTSFVCDNSSSSTSSEVYLNNNFIVGQTYYIRVYHNELVLLISSFNICVLSYPTPINDLCASAVALTPSTNCVTTTGSFSGSSNTGTSTSCSASSLQDVWYSFVATDPTMSVTITNGVNVNLGMEIITGSCSGTSFVCDNSSSSTSSEVYLNNNFTVGQTYYVRVYHNELVLLTTSFNICVLSYPTPINDLCASAVALTPSSNCVTTTGSFSGSSNTGTSTSCSASSLQDVWYSFVATDPTMSVSITNGVVVNLGMEIITGSCSGTSFVCDNSSSSTSSEVYLNNNFTVGQTYYVRVYHNELVLLTTSFNICVLSYPTPVNDVCASAVALTPSTNCVTTTGSFSGSSNTGTSTSCSASSLQDVWYSFVATDPTMSISITNGVVVNLGMEIITGSCSGTSFVCDNSSSSTSNEFYQSNTFTVGQTYYVRVYHNESVLLTTSFNICVQNPTLSIEHNILKQIKIYPNPVDDFFEIETNLNIDKVTLFNVNGQIVLIEKQKRISIPSLPNGIYFVKIEDENGGVMVKKLVKN